MPRCLGAAEVLAPNAVTRFAGVPTSPRVRRVLRVFGAREIGHGATVLAVSPRLVWTRVAGDALDVAVLTRGLGGDGADRRRGAFALLILTVIGVADVYAAADQL